MLLRLCWMLVTCFLVLWLEILLSRLSVIFPAGLFVALYFGLAMGVRRGVACGLLTGMASEIILGRSFTGMPLFVPMVLFLVYFRKWGDRTSSINHALAGMALSMINAAYFLVLENLHLKHGWSLLSGPKALGLFGVATAAGLILTPILIPILDLVGKQIAVPRFQIQSGRFLQQ